MTDYRTLRVALLGAGAVGSQVAGNRTSIGHAVAPVIGIFSTDTKSP